MTRPALTRPCRLRIREPGQPDRWLKTTDPDVTCCVAERVEDAHVAPGHTLYELALLMRRFAALSNTPLEFDVEDAS